MTTDHASVHCRPSLAHRVMFSLCAAPYLLIGALIPLGFPLPMPAFARVAAGLASASIAGFLLAMTHLSGLRADAHGLHWRDPLGRRRHAPWSDVREVRVVHGSHRFRVEYRVALTNGRTLSWNSTRPDAAALHALVVSMTDRRVYRSVGDRAVEPPITLGADHRRRRLDAASNFGFSVLALPVVCVGAVRGTLALCRLTGDVGIPLGLAALFGLPLIVGSLALAKASWNRFRQPAADTITFDARGFSVRRGDVGTTGRWEDVVAVSIDRDGNRQRVRVEAICANFVVDALDFEVGFLLLTMRPHMPAAVWDSFAVAHEASYGDVPTTTAPETFRHRPSSPFFTPSVLDVTMVLLVGFGLAMDAVTRSRGAPLHVETGRLLFAASLAIALVLVHRLTRALFFIEVSPTHCVWNGLRHRRRFAWSDVIAITLPDARTRHPLTITLSDGTRLRHLDRALAGHAHLLRTLRTRLPHLVA